MNRQNRSWIAVLLVVTGLFSCSKVDNQLGDGLIPNDQLMKVFIDTVSGINTYLTESDSFPTSGMSYGYMGAAQDATFGRTNATFATQFILNYFSSGAQMFGLKPVMDSLVLEFTLNGAFLGDTSKTQKFNIYELKDNIYYDSVYYADFDLPAIAKDQVLASFDLRGLKTSKIFVKLDTEAGRAFARRLMDTTGGAYTSDSLFYHTYKGLYFAPDATSEQDAAVYRMAFTAMEMALYTRNHTDETGMTVKDTVTTYYAFDHSTYHNGHINAISHDYTGTSIQGINDTLTTSVPVQKGYIQTLGGVATFVRFTDEFVTDLQHKLVEPYKSMVINKAVLMWNVAEPTTDHFNIAPVRIGSYSLYRSFTGIPDYDYKYETSSGETLMYDGYLSRTSGAYWTDISLFLQQLILHPETAPRTMTLGPGGDLLADFKQVVLKTGASDPPLHVVVTYTLIR